MDKDEAIHKKEENDKRQAKKSCKPKDKRYVDGWEKHREVGKGDKNRLPGWTSPKITKRLNKIFEKK
jgi:hypothetical protein